MTISDILPFGTYRCHLLSVDETEVVATEQCEFHVEHIANYIKIFLFGEQVLTDYGKPPITTTELEAKGVLLEHDSPAFTCIRDAYKVRYPILLRLRTEKGTVKGQFYVSELAPTVDGTIVGFKSMAEYEVMDKADDMVDK